MDNDDYKYKYLKYKRKYLNLKRIIEGKKEYDCTKVCCLDNKPSTEQRNGVCPDKCHVMIPDKKGEYLKYGSSKEDYWCMNNNLRIKGKRKWYR